MSRSQHGLRNIRSFVGSSLSGRGRYKLTGRYPFSRRGASAFKNRRSSGVESSYRRASARSRHRLSWPGRIVYHILWEIVFVGAKLMFRFSVEGKENLPTGAFVIAPVHRSSIDTPIAGLLSRRRMRFIGKKVLWDRKLLGAFLSAMGGFPVGRRGAADISALRAAVDVLAFGEPLVMFPEGTRLKGPRVLRSDILDGVAFVAARAGVPIVPVGLGGTARALPRGSKIPRPVRIAAVVGKPISPPPKLGGRVPRRSVKQLTDQLFSELEVLYSEARSIAGEESGERRLPWWRRVAVARLISGGSERRRAALRSASSRLFSGNLVKRVRISQLALVRISQLAPSGLKRRIQMPWVRCRQWLVFRLRRLVFRLRRLVSRLTL